MIFFQTIIRRRAPLIQDAHGNEIRDWSDAVDVTIEGVSVQPNSQEETSTALRTSVVTGWRVQSPPGADLDIEPTDRVVVAGGVVCEVEGEVARWPDPLTGDIHHVEFTVKRREG